VDLKDLVEVSLKSSQILEKPHTINAKMCFGELGNKNRGEVAGIGSKGGAGEG
jgi:hypothetical protein